MEASGIIAKKKNKFKIQHFRGFIYRAAWQLRHLWNKHWMHGRTSAETAADQGLRALCVGTVFIGKVMRFLLMLKIPNNWS